MSTDAQTEVTTLDDGRNVRTAIVIPRGGVSFDLLDQYGNHVARINAFAYHRESDKKLEHIIVDVIDVREQFDKRTALTFDDGGGRNFHPAGKIVSTDFRKEA